MLLEHQDVILKFRSPSRWKEMSKESSSKIIPSGDGSCWKTFKPIDSLITKKLPRGRLSLDSRRHVAEVRPTFHIIADVAGQWVNGPGHRSGHGSGRVMLGCRVSPP
nr:hypothetical protein [Tanacetum cinerariifolium]